MAGILHRLGIKASAENVYAALATVPGLAGWWTEETSGRSEVGGEITFVFRNDDDSIKGEMRMHVVRLEASKQVEWLVLGGPPDWIGTSIRFDLKTEDAMTILVFAHDNWKEATESTAHCSMKWATFLLSLRSLVETGAGRPAPRDLKIDNWN